MSAAPPPTQASSGPPPRRPEGWPRRPSLTFILGVLLAVFSLIVILGSRNESVLGWKIGAAIGLDEKRARPVPPPYEGLVVFRAGEAELTDITTRAQAQADAPSGGRAFVPPPVPAGPLAEALARAERESLPAAWVVATPRTLARSGAWALTRQVVEVDRQLLPVAAGASLDPALAPLAYSAAALRMESLRGAYRPFADALAAGEPAHSKLLLRGFALNAITLGLLILLVISLVPGYTGVIHHWDRALAVYEKVGPAALLGLAWTSMPAVLGILLLANIGPISDLLHTNKAAGWAGYVVVFIFSAGVGFLPTYGQSILGGWVFGFAAGFPGAMLGFVGGSLIGYGIAHRVSRHKVEDLLESNARSRAVRDALIGHGFWRTLGIVTLIRVPPNSPFALTNLVMASAGVKLLPYALGTLIGMAPRTGIAVALAAAGRASGARDIQEFIEEQPWWAVPAGVVAFMVVLGVIGLIANKALHQVVPPKADRAGK